MSSGFVSGGTIDAPIERSDEWLAANQELEANRQRKAAEARQSDGRSLFETLEANKAAKQDAFEEANRLKNQFRSLDEDEIEFLDSVLESTRAEEERIRRETAEGLSLFRAQQEEADQKLRGNSGTETAEEGSPLGEEEQWIAGGRKRKRAKEKEVLKGVKIRRSSSTVEPKEPANQSPAAAKSTSPSNNPPGKNLLGLAGSASLQLSKMGSDSLSSSEISASTIKVPPPAKGGLGLVDYGSDDDDY